MKKTGLIIFLFSFLLGSAQADKEKQADPHYVKSGFFDIHVCNWPDNPLFIMALFSLHDEDNTEEVTIYLPNGQLLGTMDMHKYKTIRKQGKPDKHVLVKHFPIPRDEIDGMFQAKIKMKDGRIDTAYDFVIKQQMPRAEETKPGKGATLTRPPKFLSWKAIPGARFYKVFIKDLWADEAKVYSSEVLTEPRYELPKDFIQSGGYYSWQIHARNINGDRVLGDFNHGSLSEILEFSVE